MTNTLEVKNLRTSFKDENKKYRDVLKDISFRLENAETLGIAGESGSGKTLTSLCIMGLLPPKTARIESGSIQFYKNDKDVIDLLKLSPKAHRKLLGENLAMIFQDPMTSLNPVKRCGNQLIESLLLHKKISKKQAKKTALDLFAEMELDNPKKIYKSYPHQLSGGQKQRVMIAMALSCNPKILIADEPTTALDVTVQQSVLALLKRLQKKFKMSIIFITHDLGVLAQIADNLIIMYEGKIVETGDVKSIFHHANHPYTKGLIACRPHPDKRLRKLPSVKDFINYNPDNLVFQPENILSAEERAEKHQQIYEQPAILEIKNLSKEYYSKKHFYSKKEVFHAVKNLSFSLYPEESLGLVGESGCGKTTLSRALLRLIDINAGNIIYRGTDLSTLSSRKMRAYRKKLQIVFQDPYSSLNERIRVGDAIKEVLVVHRKDLSAKEQRKKTEEMLEKVNLDKAFYSRYPHELSGGQRQRVCIARALVLEPEILICDESVSALDVSVQAQVLNLLNELKETFQLSYLFISHDLSVVKFMADRILIMQNGEIVEEGNPDEIYLHPQQAYTKRLIEAIPTFG
jgi:peptide/nickel transport system ATP-binding protein